MDRTEQTADLHPWEEVCARHARDLNLSGDAVSALSAFGGAAVRTAADFSALSAEARAQGGVLAERIGAALSATVDPAQAALFARRFTAVDALLGELDAPEAEILRVGLSRRMQELLAPPVPSALRVRALVDFYYSQAALLHHRAPGLPDLEQLAAGVTWRRVARGVEHGRIAGRTDQGPVFANVLRVSGGRIAARDCRAPGGLAALMAREGASAGISGGFFLYSEPDIAPPSARTDPVGLLVSDGAVLNPPILRRSALTWDGQRVGIQELGMAGVVLEQGAARIEVIAADDPARIASGAVSFSRAWGRHSPPAPQSVAVVGTRVVAVAAGPLPIPLAGAVIALPHPAAVSVGPIRWRLPLAIREAMAGGPRLLRGGVPEIDLVAQDFAGSAPPVTFSQDETFDQNLLPRMAAGLTAEGVLVLVAVDGRNFERALGLTLRQTARLCAALGCVEAMNLDGGSSKRMIIGSEAVDLSTTEVVAAPGGPERIRPVHSGVLVF